MTTTYEAMDRAIDRMTQQEIDAWEREVPWGQVAEKMVAYWLDMLQTDVPYDAHRHLVRLIREHWLGGDYAAAIAVELGFAKPYWTEEGEAA